VGFFYLENNMQTKYRSKPSIDSLTGAQRVIDELVSHIYEGLIHKVSGVTYNVGDTNDVDFLIRTPVSPALVEIVGIILIGQGNPWNVELYETPTVTTPGIEATKQFMNMYRPKKSQTTDVILYDAPTISADGLLLDEGIFGGTVGQGNQAGGLGGNTFFFGWCLDPDSYYNIRIINNTGGLAPIGVDMFIRQTTLPEGE
jgi:hypothetical protein